jgi:hypothetical protein
MPARILIRPLGAAAALAVAGAVAAAAVAAPAGAGGAHAAAAQKITPKRVGGVHIGDRYGSLRTRGLVRRIGPGCELGGPDTRSARLKAPLAGTVNFSLTLPRKVTDVTVSGGAKARGVGVGATRRAIRRAFPKVTFDHSGDGTFGLTMAKVPANHGGPIVFGVSTQTHRVTLIGIPFIAICD